MFGGTANASAKRAVDWSRSEGCASSLVHSSHRSSNVIGRFPSLINVSLLRCRFALFPPPFVRYFAFALSTETR